MLAKRMHVCANTTKSITTNQTVNISVTWKNGVCITSEKPKPYLSCRTLLHVTPEGLGGTADRRDARPTPLHGDFYTTIDGQESQRGTGMTKGNPKDQVGNFAVGEEARIAPSRRVVEAAGVWKQAQTTGAGGVAVRQVLQFAAAAAPPAPRPRARRLIRHGAAPGADGRIRNYVWWQGCRRR